MGDSMMAYYALPPRRIAPGPAPAPQPMTTPAGGLLHSAQIHILDGHLQRPGLLMSASYDGQLGLWAVGQGLPSPTLLATLSR